MAEAKFKQTTDDVGAFVAAVDSEQKRRDSATLIDIMSRITGKPPKLWGSIVGFGNYHYKYASGHEGDSCLAGFSPRKGALSIYLMAGYYPDTAARHNALLAKLGKHKMGKACLYVNKLDDIDLDVLADLIELTVERISLEYGPQK